MLVFSWGALHLLNGIRKVSQISKERKDEANDRLEHGRHMLSEEFFPAEQRDQIIFCGEKVGLVYLLVRLHNHESIYTLILSRS